MMCRKTLSCAALALAGLLTSCSGGGDGSPASGGTARDFMRSASGVSATANLGIPTTYTATQVVTITNDDAGATRIVSSWRNGIGSINSGIMGNGDSYMAEVTLTATAPSEEQARALLQTMHINHRDGVGGDTLYLDHEVRFDEVEDSNLSRSADLVATLPSTAAHELYQDMGNGDNATSGLGGPLVLLETGLGNSQVSGEWDNVLVDTGNGNVDVTVATAAGAGYDLEGDASNGTTTITVAGTSPVGEQTDEHKHYRSPDYSSSSPQVDVQAYVGLGNISIHD
jgi:hypothetical protein